MSSPADDRRTLTRRLARVRAAARRAGDMLRECEGARGGDGYLDALEEVRKMLDEVTVLRCAFEREARRVGE